MYTHTIKTRIRYGETDKMGYCYYGNYAQFFEMGRVEMLRSIGTVYKNLEEDGILLPVVNYSVNFLKPVFYDEEISIKTKIKKAPTAKIVFEYEVLNEKGEITTTAETTLVFVSRETMKPIQPPVEVINGFKKVFE